MTALSAWLGARLLAGMVAATPVPVPLAVVVDAAVVDGDALAARLIAGLEPLVQLLPPTPGTPEVAVAVRVAGELLDFRVGLALGTDGTSTWSWCPCTHAELVAHVQRQLAHALRPRSTCPPTPRAIASPPAIRPPNRPPIHPPIAKAPARERGRLGVGLVGLGGLVLGTGAGLLVGASVTEDEQWVPHTNLRPAGITTMVVGTGVLATGVLLLIFERRLPRARRRAAHP